MATPGVNPIASPATDKLNTTMEGATLDSDAEMAPGQQAVVSHAISANTSRQATPTARTHPKGKPTPATEHLISIAGQHAEGRQPIHASSTQQNRGPDDTEAIRMAVTKPKPQQPPGTPPLRLT